MNRKNRRILSVMLVAVLVLPAVATAQRIGYLRVTPGTTSVYAQWQGIRGNHYDVAVYDSLGVAVQTNIVYECRALIGSLDTNTSYKLKVTAWRGPTQGNTDSMVFSTGRLPSSYSCAPPQLVDTMVTSSTAELIWASGFQAYRWNLEYKVHGSTQWQPGLMTTTSSYASLSQLNPDTEYDIRLTEICTDTSYSTTITLHTTCVEATLPYIEDFDQWNVVPPAFNSCWRRITNGPLGNQEPNISSTRTHSGGKSLYMSSEYNYYSCVVLPPVTAPVESLLLSFYIYGPNNMTNRIMIGVLDSPDDINSFTLLDIVTPYPLRWTKVELPLNSYQGTGRYVALLSPNGEASRPYIDDIRLENIPTCVRPSMLSAITSATGVLLQWHAVSGVQQYEVSTTALGAASQGAVITSSNTNGCQITGLVNNTRYAFCVRSVCGAGDTSQWSDTLFVHLGSWSMRPNDVDTIMLCGSTLYDDGGFGADYTGMQNSYVILLPQNPGSGSMVSVQGTYAGSVTDHLYIFDDFMGTPGSPTQLCDIVSPANGAQMTVGPFTATNPFGILTVYFVSSSSESYSGFELNVSCAAPPAPSCPPVTNVFFTSVTPTSACLQWTPGGNENLWEITYNGTTVVTAMRPYTIQPLSPNTTYSVSVRPICSVGDTGAAASATVTTTITRPCDAPRCLATTSVSDTTVYVQWIGTGIFEVQYREETSQQWSSPVQVATFHYTFTGLTPNTRYNWRVRKLCYPTDTSDWDTSVFITNAVGAIDMASSSSVVVYPNPSRGEVNIHCRECTVNEVGVISLSGRYERLRYAEGRVDVSHLAAGVYYLQIVTTTDVHREKIVVGY